MLKIFIKKFQLVYCLVFVLLLGALFSNSAFAEQLKLTFKDMGIETDAQLKTVKTHQNMYFTKPDNWKAAPSSKINLVFQHSPKLLPERSSLNILINDQVIQTIDLTKGNAVKTTMAVPIPVNVLKDYNKLTFDVDQHYTYQCEDPFDTSLWTTVLNTTTVNLDYTKVEPKKDFARFPYPLFDPLVYGITDIGFVVPNVTEKSDDTLRAMTMVDASIAQHIGWKDMKVIVYNSNNYSNDKNLVVVGTPAENGAISRLSGSFPIRLSGDNFTDKSGNALEADTGVLMLVPNPSKKSSSILIVSGNSPKGVLKAATALTQLPTRDIFKGDFVIVKQNYNNELEKARDWKDYIISIGATRFHELGLESKTTRGVTSLPIEYDIKVMPDIMIPVSNDDKKKIAAKLHIIYSYAAHLEPDQSKIEVLWNGTPLHSKNFTNTDGENLAVLDVNVPTELIQRYNKLKLKMHLFPVKFDICRFSTDVHVWGSVHSNSYIDFKPANAYNSIVIPNMDPVNDGGYPFTAYRDMQNTTFVLPDNYTAYDVYGVLTTAARLAKMTQPTKGISLNVVRASNLSGDIKSKDNLIAIGTEERNKFIKDIEAELHLIYKGGDKLFKKTNEELTKLRDLPDMGIVEQMLNPSNSNRVIMILYGQNDTGLLNAISLFANSKKFEQIGVGNIVAVTADTVKTITSVSRSKVKELAGTDLKTVTTWDFWWNIIKIALMIIGVLAILKILFGAFIRGASGR